MNNISSEILTAMSRLSERELKPQAIVVGPRHYGNLVGDLFNEATSIVKGPPSKDFVVFGLPVELDYDIEGFYVRAAHVPTMLESDQ